MREFLFAGVGLVWGVLLMTTMPEPPAKPVPGWATTCELDRVIDGDTIDVRVSRVIRVRLLDCWAPETRDPGGPESTANLKKLLVGGLYWLSECLNAVILGPLPLRQFSSER